MSFCGLEELRPYHELAERFAKNELEPKALEYDNYPFASFNQTALERAFELGFFNLMLPEKLGGAGENISALSEILSTLAQKDASFSAIIFTHCLAQSALLKWGSDSLKEKFLQKGLLAFPIYDSPCELQRDAKAEKSGRVYILNGRIEYLCLAPLADAFVLPAVTNDNKVGLFIVDAKTSGIDISEPVLSLGLRSCPVADLELKNVEVNADQLLLEDALKEYPFLAHTFAPAVVAMALGVLTASYQTALEYAEERYQGGKMIIDYDQVRMMLVNMRIVIECGKALLREMLLYPRQSQSNILLDSALILLCETISRATTDGVQVLGGYGYMQDYGQEKRMRDAKQIQGIFGSAPLKRMELFAKVLGH